MAIPAVPDTDNTARNGVFGRLTLNEINEVSMFMRSRLQQLVDPRRDLDGECGYPASISPQMYKDMYDREGVATRVVNVYPEECWAMDPEIYESEVPENTPFEDAWVELNNEMNIVEYLSRIDEMSGIGHFGVLLLGLDDGGELNDPVDGVADDGTATPGLSHKLQFMRTFDESMVRISKWEVDRQSPRFGLPVEYDITFNAMADGSRIIGGMGPNTNEKVHWTRIIHVADNRKGSEVYGTPRQQTVFNRICDIRKTFGGSAEMFWKGGFPGYSFETNPDLLDVTLDKEAMREEFENYSNGLQRYLALTGVQAKSLNPQVASPEHHLKVQLMGISIALGVPYRVFVGSEEARIQGAQDSQIWNKRLARRNTKYVGPHVVRPTVDRFIKYGILPKPKSQYYVVWPDLNTSTDQEKADSAAKRATAIATYVGSNSELFMPPLEFMVHVLHYPLAVAEQIIKAAEERGGKLEIAPKNAAIVAEQGAKGAQGVKKPKPPGALPRR